MALTRIQSDSIANGAVTALKFDTTAAEQLGMRNRIINGAMQINQRNAANVSANGYTLDRWKFATTNTSLGGTVNYDNSGTLGKSVGYLKFSTTTAGSTLASTDNINISQPIEGFNVGDLQWGTSYAAPVTLSFWIRVYTSGGGSGNYTGAIQNNDKTLSYVFTFNVPNASNWQYVTITIPGCQYGTWTNNNTIGMNLVFNLGAGSTFASSLNNAWDWGNFTTTSAVSVQTLANASYGNFHLAQVQLEKGSVATPFEFRPYGTELNLCQRYYWQATASPTSYAHFASGCFSGSSNIEATLQYPQTMRTTPTFTFAAANTFIADGAGSFTLSAIQGYFATPTHARIQGTVSGATAGQGTHLGSGGGGAAAIYVSAEL